MPPPIPATLYRRCVRRLRKRRRAAHQRRQARRGHPDLCLHTAGRPARPVETFQEGQTRLAALAESAAPARLAPLPASRSWMSLDQMSRACGGPHERGLQRASASALLPQRGEAECDVHQSEEQLDGMVL